MDTLSGFTSTSLGYLLAYILPGLSAVFTASLYSRPIHRVLLKFEVAGSDLGLFLLVLMASLAVGLIMVPFRSFVFGKVFCRHTEYPSADQYKRLNDPATLQAFRAAVDESYRYAQFWGSFSLVLPFLAVGILKGDWSQFSGLRQGISVTVAVIIEVTLIYSAVKEFNDFARKSNYILS